MILRPAIAPASAFHRAGVPISVNRDAHPRRDALEQLELDELARTVRLA